MSCCNSHNAIIFIVVTILAPIVPQVVWSFAFRWYFPDILPSVWSMDSWSYVFTESSRVGEGLVNSIQIALVVSVLSVATSIERS